MFLLKINVRFGSRLPSRGFPLGRFFGLVQKLVVKLTIEVLYGRAHPKSIILHSSVFRFIRTFSSLKS